MNAVFSTMEAKWPARQLDFQYYPETKKGTRRGRLTTQNVQVGEKLTRKFSIFGFLYVDDGTTLFEDRESMIAAAELIFAHFARFGLEVHIGQDGGDSKTEFVHFPANEIQTEESMMRFDVGDGYMTATDKFKYLGSWLHLTLSDDYDIMKRIQAGNAAMAVVTKLFKKK